MENIPDRVELVLDLYRGKNRTDVEDSFQKQHVPRGVEFQVEETLPIGAAIGVGILVKFASELAWRAYLREVEPRLKEFGHLIHVKYFRKGVEIPPPKNEEAPSAPEAKGNQARNI